MTNTSSDVAVQDGATVGVSYRTSSEPPKLGPDSVVRGGTIIYDDVTTGPGFVTGHHALVREQTTLGRDVLVGTQAVIDGACAVGNAVSMQTGAYVPRETTIEDRVFLGPQATLLNDPHPVRTDAPLEGPTLEADVSIGANATVLPGVRIGEGSFVAAGAVVTEDVPANRLAVGVPARTRALPEELQGGNDL
jgi:acetyltransferase-like isoleucine patch superfamily enzyme